MQLQKIAREWRDVYFIEIVCAAYEGREPSAHALSAWARYDSKRRSEKPFDAAAPEQPLTTRGRRNR